MHPTTATSPPATDAGSRARLHYAPPYAWHELLEFLGARAIDNVETTDAGVYRRTFRVGHAEAIGEGWLEVAHSAAAEALEIRVAPALASSLPAIVARVEHVFDLAADPAAIAGTLGELAAPSPGLRVPGAFDGFELAVRAVLGQQITVKAARTLAARFAAAFGSALATPWAGLTRVFPAPAHVAGLTQDAVASLGIIGTRARTIIGLAEALAAGRIVLAPGQPHTATVQALKALPGIGEWTAQYIAMRALGARDAFPHTDYGVMKALDERNPRRVLARAEAWRPWRAYAVMHLWRSLA